jgi:hypothetical protein
MMRRSEELATPSMIPSPTQNMKTATTKKTWMRIVRETSMESELMRSSRDAIDEVYDVDPTLTHNRVGRMEGMKTTEENQKRNQKKKK